jgi:hypothetical protein
MRKSFAFIVLMAINVGCNQRQPSDSTIEEYYPNGSLRSRVQYAHDTIKEGTAIYYYENGQVSGQGLYKQNEKHGSYTDYYSNGVVKEKGMYRNGKPVGSFYYYYSNGNLRTYDAKDYGNESYYVIKFDSLGNKIYDEGLTVSPTVGASLIKEAYEVGDSIELYHCIAAPPGYKPEVRIGLYKYVSNNETQDLLDSFKLYPVKDGIATYRYTFKSSGYYRITCIGKLVDSLGNLVKENTAYSDVFVK